jgi:catechol 2,3-dioxygenase-like lactoylglutathione lyase family enzyme
LKLELIAVPVSDVDRAKTFYVDQVGFAADHDHQVNEELRFVQLTLPGPPARSLLTTGAHEMEPARSRACSWSSRTPTRRGRSSPSAESR